ncbi:MAG TPA: hypothetical protein ENJ20_02505 [Bacteroidetes bacterium]|nr:hypothetical protein [Bacteroidota bacterium]
MQEIFRQYEERRKDFSQKARLLRQRYDRISLVRLLVFVISVGIAIVPGSFHWVVAALFLFLFIAGFYRLVQWHGEMLEKATHFERLAKLNEQEYKALQFDYTGFPSGKQYLHPEHPNALDLDLFGQYSLFRYCCRATTTIGQDRLADYLSAAATVTEIELRQVAIGELKWLLDWRQHFQAYGIGTNDDPAHLVLLRKWLSDEDWAGNNHWLKAACIFAPVWFVICTALWVFFIPWQAFLLLWMVPPGILLGKVKKKVDRTHLRTTHAVDMLTQYERLLKHIEGQVFLSKKLTSLTAPLYAGGGSASGHIRQLSYIISQLNVRNNFFAIFLNLLLMWDIRWIYRLENWRAVHKENLPVWLEALGELEALSSLANCWYNNPDWTLPRLTNCEHLDAIELGHPLIAPDVRVCNDLSMPIRGHIKLITGSNMAGKSTFLRTVGINVVLALSGAPVCAAKLELPPMEVFTSMRTVDALHESTSSFYAELKRLKTIIEAVEKAGKHENGQLPVFFLLDEILKGTNSIDRHTGSKALIKQLIHLQGGGLIATHDLELGQLEASSNGAIENLCMEVEVKNGQLTFDYKIKKGVSKSFNATLLMQQMGIDVEKGMVAGTKL